MSDMPFSTMLLTRPVAVADWTSIGPCVSKEDTTLFIGTVERMSENWLGKEAEITSLLMSNFFSTSWVLVGGSVPMNG